MAATMALVRAQPTTSMSKGARGGKGRGRKQQAITLKTMGVGAVGVIAGGAMTAGLFRLGVPPTIAAGATVGVGAIGAAMAAKNTRVFFLGHAAGGAAMLTASFAGAFRKPETKPKDDAKDPKKLEAGTKSEVVPTAPTSAKDANPPRNASPTATFADEMRARIAGAVRETRERQAA
jgi:hypothetical protein